MREGSSAEDGAGSYRTGVLDQAADARRKQDSRDRDQARLDAGEVTQEDLARENGFFSALDVAGFEIVSIGGRPPRAP